MKNIVFLFLCILMSCKPNASHYVDFIEGYWEIERVTKNGRIIKEFKISTGIDYFKIYDNKTGFRKKLKPNFQGTFETSEDQLNFNLKLDNNTLLLVYNDNGTSYSEKIVLASATALVITNTEELEYHYKPYEPLNFDK